MSLDRPPNTQYRDLLSRVLNRGGYVPTRQGVSALTAVQETMRFDLAGGFPVITERDLGSFWRKPISELCAFINGATTLEELVEFGCDWWGPWATEEKCAKRGLPAGDLGPGSYGGAFAHFPDGTEHGFDQFEALIEGFEELPYDRTHVVTPWIPHYLTRAGGRTPKATIAPCHGWVHLTYMDDRQSGTRLHLHMVQRSGDLPIGVPSNMIQYAALLLMISHLTGAKPGVYHHTISNAHIYTPQIPAVRQMLEREPRPLPTVYLNAAWEKVKRLRDFRGEHFELDRYDPHPAIPGIPVAV